MKYFMELPKKERNIQKYPEPPIFDFQSMSVDPQLGKNRQSNNKNNNKLLTLGHNAPCDNMAFMMTKRRIQNCQNFTYERSSKTTYFQEINKAEHE